MSYDDEPARVLDEDKRILNETMHEFYELLPYREVEEFDREKAVEGELEDFRGRIDNAQDLFEQIEAMRLQLTSTYTEGELIDMDFRQLQRTAKLNRINHRQNRYMLVAELKDKPRTIRAWRQLKQLKDRMDFARKRADHPHPRQQATIQWGP